MDRQAFPSICSVRADRIRHAGVVLLTVLTLSLPFEIELSRLPAQVGTLTNIEVLVALVLVAAGWLALLDRSSPVRLPWLAIALLALFVAAATVSAIMAPEHRGNALRATARTAAGMMLATGVTLLIRSRRDLRWIFGGVVVGALFSASLGLVEFLLDGDLPLLALFRERMTRAGPFARLTGSFDYANQTSMYIEAAVSLLLALVLVAWARRRRRMAMAGGSALLFLVQAAILTYSRAAIVSLIASIAFVGVLSARRGRVSFQGVSATPWLACATACVLMLIANLALDPISRLRFGRGSPEQWYRADVLAPPYLELESGGVKKVRVQLVNAGALEWLPSGDRKVLLSVRTHSERGEWAEGGSWSLPGPVAPGDTAILTVQLTAPPAPGAYGVHWDLIHQGVTSFHAATGQKFVSTLEVRPITPGKPAPAMPEEDAVIERVEQPERAPLAPSRGTLWRIAAADFRERPLLGLGLDNYRLRYGRHLGWEEWNETLHTNNWYIETLVSVGLLGGVPFHAFLAILVVDIVRRTPRAAAVEELAVGAALMAFMIHGMLDYFLLFHATGILFWVLVGAWWGVTRIVPRQVCAKPTRTSYPTVLQ